VTTPGGDAARLAAIAAWDVPLLRGAIATMEAVAGRLRSWRARLEGVGRALASEEYWAGAAARSAVEVVDELASAAWVADSALHEAVAAFGRLGTEAAAAQDRAEEAVALAAVPDLVRVVLTPGPSPATTAAGAALAHAAAASTAASAADAALVGVGMRVGAVAAGLADLSEPPAAGPPVGRPPPAVAGWWASLPATAQLAAIRRMPAALGRLDGIPAWARDRANRRALAQAVADPRTSPPAAVTARALVDRIRGEEAAGRTVQLHLLDLEHDRVALALGDLDTADAVALMVPGVGNTPLDDLGRLLGDARDVDWSARSAAWGVTVATVVWLGYRTPGSALTVASRASAWQGGPALAATLAGLDAARTATGGRPPRTTVLAHSYGTVVVDEAADAPGQLAADAVVLSGSPGMEENAVSLEVTEVYDAAAVTDPVSWLAWFGRSTWALDYGSTGLPGEPGMGHSDYYAPGSSTLAAIGEVVAGTREPD